MRPDQIEKLKQLSEDLADRFISDADSTTWSGSGKTPADMTQEERGNAYWCRKMAMATAGVLRFTLDITKAAGVNEGDYKGADNERDADLDKQINEAERRAKAALQKVLARVK